MNKHIEEYSTQKDYVSVLICIFLLHLEHISNTCFINLG
jgi:hypothetical protein